MPAISPTFDPPGAAWRLDQGAAGSQGMWIGNTGGASNVIIPASSVAGPPYGSPLVAEATPVVLADVPASRRIILTPTKQGLYTTGGGAIVRIYAYGASSGTISYNCFLWEAMLQKWIMPITNPSTGTFTATQFVTLTQLTFFANFTGGILALLVNANAAGAPYMCFSMH